MADTKSRPSSSGTMSQSKKHKPFPLRQLLILALCRFSEPIAFTSIFPYIYYMVESFHIASDERTISVYAGAITSAFALAEFSTAAMWGRLSDRVGRKPVLLMGLFGTGLSNLIFGLSLNFPLAIVARVLGGLLNGNIGVIQTTVAEIVTDKEQQPRAYTFMPLTWCLGSVIGNLLGGALADPVNKYPGIFHRGGILEKYPFLLPNLVATAQCIISVTVGLLYLEESHAQKKYARDRGLELGSWISQKLNVVAAFKRRHETRSTDHDGETSRLLTSSVQPSCISSTTTPKGSRSEESIAHIGTTSDDEESVKSVPKASLRDTFTSQVLLAVSAYGLLALHTVVYDMLLPVTLAQPESYELPSLPFRFSGGFGLSSSMIGVILSSQAIYNLFFQLVLSPTLLRTFGSLKMYRFLAPFYALLYLVTPYLVLLPSSLRLPALAIILIWKVSFGSLGYLAVTLLITNSAPSLLVLGTINGVAASAASLARAIGPTMFGAIHSASLRVGLSPVAWWVAAAVAVAGAVESRWLQEPDGTGNNLYAEQEYEPMLDAPEAAGGGSTLIENEGFDAAITGHPSEAAAEESNAK